MIRTCGATAIRPYSANKAKCCRLSSWILRSTLYIYRIKVKWKWVINAWPNVWTSEIGTEVIGTWNELTNVDSPKICAVNAMLVSLSNIPCVSIRRTATCSFDPFGVRRKGSDHIQIPVVCLSCPPRHAKLVSSLSSVPSVVRSFMFPSNSSEPKVWISELKIHHWLDFQVSYK